MAATASIPNRSPSSELEVVHDRAVPGAIVMGADYRGLGVVRSLGRRGIPVWLINRGGHFVASASRYVGRRIRWPEADEGASIDFLLDLAAEHRLQGWVLIPTDDYAVGLVSHHYEALSQAYRPTVPPWESLRWACDKRLMHCLAEKLSICQPWTLCAPSLDLINETDFPFPVIIKPAVRLKPMSIDVPKAWPADDRRTLLARFAEASSAVGAENLIIQEVVPGGGETQLSYAALCIDGSVVASVVARRTRQYPRDFGQFSTFVETVDEPAVEDASVRILASLKFTGLAEVEFKKDPRNGRFKLLDINPRVWGWHTLSRRAGVDFPYLLWRMCCGHCVAEHRGRAGESWMHMSADFRVAIGEIFAGRLSLRDYLRSLLQAREGAVFAWDDPMPGLLDLPLFAGTAAKRLLKNSRK